MDQVHRDVEIRHAMPIAFGGVCQNRRRPAPYLRSLCGRPLTIKSERFLGQHLAQARCVAGALGGSDTRIAMPVRLGPIADAVVHVRHPKMIGAGKRRIVDLGQAVRIAFENFEAFRETPLQIDTLR